MVSYFCKNCNIKIEKSECSVCGKRAELKSELFWCENCNIPTYTEECPICHGHGGYFTSDARPVFPEERLLVETLLGKPLAFINDSVWNGSGNRYYVNGKKIPLTISKIDELNPEEIRNTIEKYERQNTYSAFDSMVEKWVTANSTHFDFITTEAKQYIAGFSRKYINDETNAAFVSFSGGKDSTVVSDLVRKALGNPSVIHIFGNTTLEFPQTYEYIERFKKANRKTPLLRAENKEQDFFNLCETFGPPSRALRWCCTIFKTGFIGDKIRKTFPDRKSILTFYGIRRSESTSRNNYERSSEGKKISKQLVASPIIDWLDYDSQTSSEDTVYHSELTFAIQKYEELEREWVKSTIAPVECSLSKWTAAECVRWLDYTQNLPDYLTDALKKRYSKIRISVEDRLKTCRIDGVVTMFNNLSDSEKKQCLDILLEEMN